MGYEKESIREEPFFSIIIPAYNAQKDYFAQCLESVVGQTFGDIEIIVVDDGSTADCAAYYDEAAASDPRVRVVHQPNKGVSAARNCGIEKARSPWIMFVDSDDWIDLDACEKIRTVLEEQTCDMLLFDHVKEYANGTIAKQATGLNDNTLYLTSDIRTKEKLYRRAMGTPNTGTGSLSTIYYSVDKVYSRSLLQKENFSPALAITPDPPI